jgi:hypothetical protein
MQKEVSSASESLPTNGHSYFHQRDRRSYSLRRVAGYSPNKYRFAHSQDSLTLSSSNRRMRLEVTLN